MVVVQQSPLQLTLAGRMDDEAYQKNLEAARFLARDRPAELAVAVRELFPVEWEALLRSLREQALELLRAEGVGGGGGGGGGSSSSTSSCSTILKYTEEEALSTTPCLVYSADLSRVWAGEEFAAYVTTFTRFKLFSFPPGSPDLASYAHQARIHYRQFLQQTGHLFCYLRLSIAGQPQPETLVLELYPEVCPHTCENFRHLCLGDLHSDSLPPAEPKATRPSKLHYQGTHLFRVVRDGWVQGGDVVNDRGNAGHSIFGRCFADESFAVRHDREGVLGMANSGSRDTNASQFYITVRQNSWMDHRYVAFGRVVDGMALLRRVHSLPALADERPAVEVQVTDCGELQLDKLQ